MIISITGANLRNDNFRVDRDSKLFPDDSWGGTNKQSSATPVQFIFEGTNEEVDTDIDRIKRVPRNARGEIGRFFKHHQVKEGQSIELIKMGERRFYVKIQREVPTSLPIPALIPSPVVPLFPKGSEVANRSTTLVDRIIRETAVTDHVKSLYGCKCQVCGLALSIRRGLYAEGAHIRPLGTPHNGPDQVSNVLCLCPNHHVMLDGGTLSVNDDYSLVGAPGSLHVHTDHKINLSHLQYHRSIISESR